MFLPNGIPSPPAFLNYKKLYAWLRDFASRVVVHIEPGDGIEIEETDPGYFVISATESDVSDGGGSGDDTTPPTGTMFAVKITNDGGSNGDQSTQASYTYTVTTLDGLTTLGTTMTPQVARPSVGAVKTSSSGRGIGYFESDTFYLWSAGETPDAESCS